MADARYLVDAFAARGSASVIQTADVLAQRFARRVVPDMPEPYARVDGVARPLPADVPLLVVHDRADREVAASESLRLHAAHGERSRLVLTDGAGHARVLGVDASARRGDGVRHRRAARARPGRHRRGGRARGIRLKPRADRVRPGRAPRRPRA